MAARRRPPCTPPGGSDGRRHDGRHRGGDPLRAGFPRLDHAQAAALRAASAGPALDHENLAEEIEALGRRDRQDIEAKVATIIQHLVKLEFSPAAGPRPGWRATVREARRTTSRSLRASPSLRRAAREAVADEAPAAIGDAVAAVADHQEAVQVVQAALTARGYTPEQVLDDWWPDDPTPAA